jgi:hypothetical protein
MSAPKTLSQISLAAVALLIVSIPSFAQTETTDKNNAASVTDSSAVVAVNRESVTRESRIEANGAPAADTKAPKFSADKFMQAVDESPNVTIKSSSVFRPVPNNFERKSSSRITFVPSVKPAAPGVTQ